jgi:hypothetical protein
MTGPEHYTAAESLLAEAAHVAEQGGDMGEMLTAAQVHATLALAAATAQGALVGCTPDGLEGMSVRDMHAWNDVAGITTTAKAVAA